MIDLRSKLEIFSFLRAAFSSVTKSIIQALTTSPWHLIIVISTHRNHHHHQLTGIIIIIIIIHSQECPQTVEGRQPTSQWKLRNPTFVAAPPEQDTMLNNWTCWTMTCWQPSYKFVLLEIFIYLVCQLLQNPHDVAHHNAITLSINDKVNNFTFFPTKKWLST